MKFRGTRKSTSGLKNMYRNGLKLQITANLLRELIIYSVFEKFNECWNKMLCFIQKCVILFNRR